MEPIAHLEWTIGVALIIAAITGVSLDGWAILLLGIGSSFPDIFDAFVFRGKNFLKGHRELSHTLLFIIALGAISLVVKPLIYLTIGSILHILEDILAGGSSITLLSPFTHKGKIMLLDKEKTVSLGGKIRRLIKGAYVGSENIGDELSWFWFFSITGTWILVLGLFMYFQSL